MKNDLLLVIDMQNVYGEGGTWYCPRADVASENIREILDRNIEGLEVVFTEFRASEEPDGIWRAYNIENRMVNEDPYANEIMAEFSEYLKQYPLYEKSVYSSLAIPEVYEVAMAADRVVVSGVVSECCVLSTIMALIDAGIYVVYLTDACAGLSKETEAAVETILDGLEPLHVRRMTTEAYLREHLTA